MRRLEGRDGSILLITLIMLSLVLVLADRFVRGINVHARYAQIYLAREQAKSMAIGGITVALAQINSAIQLDDENKDPKNSQKTGKSVVGRSSGQLSDEQLQSLYDKLLPHLNRWQKFKLDEKNDGIEGTLRFCISSEDGKIPINRAYDFEKNIFKKPYDEFIKKAYFSDSKKNEGDVEKGLIEFFTKREKKLDDVSQIVQLRSVELFYKPFERNTVFGGNGERRASGIYDLFTVWGSKDGLNPLLLSNAICSVLGLRRPEAEDAENRKEIFKKVAKKISKTWVKEWEKHFSDIMPIYSQASGLGVNGPGGLSKLKGALSAEIEPRVFSVLSCGKVLDTEQCVVAIVRRLTDTAKPDKSKAQTLSFLVPPGFEVIRFFWL